MVGQPLLNSLASERCFHHWLRGTLDHAVLEESDCWGGRGSREQNCYKMRLLSHSLGQEDDSREEEEVVLGFLVAHSDICDDEN